MQRDQRPPGPVDGSVEFRAYFDVLRRRSRLVGLCLAAFLGLSAAYTYSRTPVYTASSEVLINPPSSTQGYSPDQLVSLDTEAKLVTSAPIAEIAAEQLQSTLAIRSLLEHVSVETTPETLLLDISFWATDPNVAAAGAEAFARAYLEHRRESAQESVVEQRSLLQALIDESEAERDRQNRILEKSPAGSAEFRNAQAQRDTLNGQIAILTSQLAQIALTVDPGQVILPASPPLEPSSPNHLVDLALGGFLGAFVGVIGAFARDRLDDRIRTEEDLEACVDAPVLAAIPRISGWARHGPSWLVTENQPDSAGAEAYRTLRTSVMAMARQRQVKVIVVVGATVGEGKTSTTANLASALAHADSRVLAISADLRKPRLHDFFEIDNDVGLSDLLTGAARLQDVIRQHDPTLFVIPGGTPTARPAELLESTLMEEVLRSLRERFDFILIDTPPVLGLADALAVAPLADAVVLVAHADTSRRSALLQAEQQLEQVGAQIHGCVLTNVVIGRDNAYLHGYGYAYREAAPGRDGRRGAFWRRVARPPAPDAEPANARSGTGARAPDPIRNASRARPERAPDTRGPSRQRRAEQRSFDDDRVAKRPRRGGADPGKDQQGGGGADPGKEQPGGGVADLGKERPT